MSDLQQQLDKFGRNVVKFSRSNLTRQKKNVDKKLYNSLGYNLKVHKGGFTFSFDMEAYGQYQDAGVNGKSGKILKNWNKSVFLRGSGYKSKMPPFDPLYKWVKKRRLNLRDSKGRFSKGGQKTLAFLIQKKIYKDGIQPSLFFSKPFNAAYKSLPNELIEAYGIDIDKLIQNSK